MKKTDLELAKDLHDDLRNILIEYGNEEYGDCIVDDICNLFNYTNTVDVLVEELFLSAKEYVKSKLDYVLEDDDNLVGGTSFNGETLRYFLEECFDIEDIPTLNDDDINEALIMCGIKTIKFYNHENNSN